jgi:hypothetical protein
MQIFKKLTLAAVTALAMVGMTAANADTPTFFLIGDTSDPVYTYYDFTSVGQDGTDFFTHSTLSAADHTAGETFTDNFIFAANDSFDLVAAISFAVRNNGLSSQVNFSSVGLYSTAFPTGALGAPYSFTTSYLGENFYIHDATVPEGLYTLSVTGTYLVDGADFNGLLALSSTSAPVSAVPESANVTLLLAGMGVLAVAARRRKNAQA